MDSNSEILDELKSSSAACDYLNMAMISESIDGSNDPEELSTDLRLNSTGLGLENSHFEECQRMTESLRALHQKTDNLDTNPPDVDMSSIIDTLPLINVSLPVSSSDNGDNLLNRTIDMNQNVSFLSFLFNPIEAYPEVESLIYWRDVKKSGAVFVGGLVLIFTLIYCTLISVISYLSMIVLSGTMAFRTYKMIMQAIQKNSFEHPFKPYLEMNLKLSDTKSKEVANLIFDKSYEIIDSLRRLFLVEDMVDSIKFFIVLYSLTYLGKWFNGLTICLLVFVSLFTMPKIYEVNKSQIDANMYLVSSKCNEIALKIKAMLPMGQKKPENDKKKD